MYETMTVAYGRTVMYGDDDGDGDGTVRSVRVPGTGQHDGQTTRVVRYGTVRTYGYDRTVGLRCPGRPRTATSGAVCAVRCARSVTGRCGAVRPVTDSVSQVDGDGVGTVYGVGVGDGTVPVDGQVSVDGRSTGGDGTVR